MEVEIGMHEASFVTHSGKFLWWAPGLLEGIRLIRQGIP
jgi:hypothetical protein